MSKLTEYIEERRLVQLPPGEPVEQIHEIMDRPDVQAYVPAIDAPVLYDLVKRAGWEEAQPLMQYVSPEQVQTFVDLDCWRRDAFEMRRIEPWLAAIVAEASDADLRKHCRSLDPEVLAMYFHGNLLVGVFDEEGMAPDEFWDKDVERSPDGIYALVYTEDENTAALLRGLLARLYAVDRVLAWTLLEAARWELWSPMEEEAFRWRRSRMEELGFVDFDEALGIYKPLDPAGYRDRLESGKIDEKIRVAVPSTMPALPTSATGDAYWVVEVMQNLEGAELEQAMAEFVALQNRAFVAEGIEPSETSQGQFVAERTTGYLSIGLEFVSRGNAEQALDILRNVALRDVFRVGFTIVDRLRDNVARLRRRPTMSIVDGQRFSLLRGADEALCEALLNARPMYAPDADEREMFSTQAQVDDAATRLGVIAFKQLWLFALQEVSPGELVKLLTGNVWRNDPTHVTFDAVFGTWVAARLLDRPPDMYGLKPNELDRLARRLAERPWGDDSLGYFEELVGRVLETLPAAARLMTIWLNDTLNELSDELAGVTEVDNPEYFTPFLLLRSS